mgnify:CR=1 FL=1
MNKKEISEIKKQFTPENCSLTRICGCYVDGEKNKKTELKEAFLSLSEEEMFKYFEIFRKSLSGTIGKNLMNMEFPLEQETEGGTQHFLMKLRESKLTDDALVESFYDKIIENYDYPENYYIILIHGVYDIPGKSSDGAEMFDASDEIYEHIMCCICPVKLSKAGLCYNAETNSIQDRIRDWIVELPDVAFLFPTAALTSMVSFIIVKMQTSFGIFLSMNCLDVQHLFLQEDSVIPLTHWLKILWATTADMTLY